MDPKRLHGKHHISGGGNSSSDSSCESPASPSHLPANRASLPGANAFANDGSFMEMFKKKMEQEEEKKRKKESEQTTAGGEDQQEEGGQTSVEKKLPPVTSFVGKRRGGVFLKTGMVAKKLKDETEREPGKSDAWSSYMAEVKKYKAHQCGDDDKTRPLVK
ncbi:telomerase RNA component interacting RNase isoform X1 [Gymnodraco acuticeps]|uniref:Telomerase RNA component interacting RNase isoform X1 n=1 Tax=Gymnodraco acuticeps TaxID=8218 RepID=A0A6P8VFR0_GYMAC|nr:telomerase RNA component interacting RNase isoform X1 [Gymnodraco acuticeps]